MNYRSTINPTVSLGINQQISKTAVGSPRTSAPDKVLKGAGGGGGVSTYRWRCDGFWTAQDGDSMHF